MRGTTRFHSRNLYPKASLKHNTEWPPSFFYKVDRFVTPQGTGCRADHNPVSKVDFVRYPRVKREKQPDRGHALEPYNESVRFERA